MQKSHPVQSRKPTTWQVSCDGANKELSLSLLHLSFRYLQLESAADIQKSLHLSPVLFLFGNTHMEDMEKDSNSNLCLLKNYECSIDSTIIIVDLSRNWLISIHLPQILDALYSRFMTMDLFKTTLPFKFFYACRVLNLSSNQLKTFPAFFDDENQDGGNHYSCLEEIYLGYNQISLIPTLSRDPPVHQFPRLKVLDLSHNKLTDINGLSHLLARDNPLKHLSFTANTLTYTSLTHLPYLENLENLSLFANNLEILPNQSPVDSLVNILCLLKPRYPMLKELHLLGNPLISSLHLNDYRNIVHAQLPSLTHLDGVAF